MTETIVWILVLLILGILLFELGYNLGKRHERKKQERDEVK